MPKSRVFVRLPIPDLCVGSVKHVRDHNTRNFTENQLPRKPVEPANEFVDLVYTLRVISKNTERDTHGNGLVCKGKMPKAKQKYKDS